MSSRVNTPFAPMQCHAGRSPLGRTGITEADVCASALVTRRPVSTPSPLNRVVRVRPIESAPTAPMLRTPAPRRLSTTAVPPAVPAGEKAMVSTRAPAEPSGMDSIPIAWTSRTCTPTVAIVMDEMSVIAGSPWWFRTRG